MLDRLSLLRWFLPRLGGRIIAPLIARARTEHGQSLVELAVLLPVLCLLLLAIIDFGRAYYLSIEVSNAAYAGAAYGMQNPTDTTGMTAAANNDAHDVSGGVSPSITYGCECSDSDGSTNAWTNVATCQGTTPTTTCATHGGVVNFVKVKTSATYNTMFPWPGIPSSFALTGNARMRASQ